MQQISIFRHNNSMRELSQIPHPDRLDEASISSLKPCSGEMRGKTEHSKAAIMEFSQQFRRDGCVLLFRGQVELTAQVLSSLAREGGLDESKSGLQIALQKEEAKSREVEGWLLERKADDSVRNLANLQAIYEREENYLRNTTLLERAALQHTQFSNNESCFISTSTSIDIAMGNYPGGFSNRFIYVLCVPESETIDVRKAFTTKDPEVTIRNPRHMLLREEEYMIVHDATRFVAAVIDLENGNVYEPQDLVTVTGLVK